MRPYPRMTEHTWSSSQPVITHCVHGLDLRINPRCYLCDPVVTAALAEREALREALAEAYRRGWQEAVSFSSVPPAEREAEVERLRVALVAIGDLATLPLDAMRDQHGSEQRVLMAVIPSIVDAALAETPEETR
jgi:hypothetical protein